MMQWQTVDEGWGRSASDFAALSEPGNCREYVALHAHLGVSVGDRLVDMACGAGLAVELAAARGATCSGIDASARLIEVARERSPDADLQVGDMQAMPWAADSFDVVTSFRGIWGTTPEALTEALRVLVPGGRLGITVWGHIKASPGAWALKPFSLAQPDKVANQSAMVALGRPGVGEELLEAAGFRAIERVEILFAWEFSDPAMYARALASTGPAYEAISAIGEEAFLTYCTQLAAERVRVGLPLRAEIAVVGFLARKPCPSWPSGFLQVPETSEEIQALYDVDIDDRGYVMNASKLWAHHAVAHDDLFALMGKAVKAAGLTLRLRGILVSACASTMGDSYCSLAWGCKLANEAGAPVAAGVLRGDDRGLTPAELALATWARRVTRDPNGTQPADVAPLRAAGYSDSQIFAVTLFIALRLAFSTVNDALGARPDRELGAATPDEVLAAVTRGRPIQD